jgi:hypothetical protein
MSLVTAAAFVAALSGPATIARGSALRRPEEPFLSMSCRRRVFRRLFTLPFSRFFCAGFFSVQKYPDARGGPAPRPAGLDPLTSGDSGTAVCQEPRVRIPSSSPTRHFRSTRHGGSGEMRSMLVKC